MCVLWLNGPRYDIFWRITMSNMLNNFDKLTGKDSIHASHLSMLAMIENGDEPSVVIDEGFKKRWVGFSWVNEGRATDEDRELYPSVSRVSGGKKEPVCPKCKNTRTYMYDENHATVCDLCCKHDKGWWIVTKDTSGFIEGTDNACCSAGCGTMRRDLKKGVNNETSEK
jgi:hypothetical protein